MDNPWKEIDLKDYENHMRLDSVLQLQALNEIMREQFRDYPARSVMILGVAGGNGLEHIGDNAFERVYGVDINQSYLTECSKRHPDLRGVLETICADLMDENLQLPHSELLIANLLIEYIGYTHFQRVVGQVKPRFISCCIQINADSSFVSDSPYLHVFDRLDEVHHQMEKNALAEAMARIGYKINFLGEKMLPNGKKLARIDFKR